MINESGYRKTDDSGRRMVLAENYRMSPLQQKQSREAAYDPPKRVTIDSALTIAPSESDEIQTAVHDVVKAGSRLITG